MKALVTATHKNVCGLAPFSVCIALRICATASMSVPFAISDGWNCTPAMPNHLLAPLVLSPIHSTMMSRMNENKSIGSVAILKYLHGMFSTPSVVHSPTKIKKECLISGPQ